MSEIKLFEKEQSIITLTYDNPLVREGLKVLNERYSNTPLILDTLDFNAKEGVVKGCHFFYKTSLTSILRELSKEDLTPMTQQISEMFIDRLPEVNSTYEDSGFTVYPKWGTHSKLWNHLRKQTKTYFNDIDLEIPFVVEGLVDVIKDNNFDDSYNLRVDFNKDSLTKVTQVPILTKGDGTFDSKDEGLSKNGFPYKLNSNGNRQISTAGSGVRRLYRIRDLDLNFGNGDLINSSENGRVCVAKNFSGLNLEDVFNYRTNLEDIRKSALKTLNCYISKEESNLKIRIEKAREILLP